MDEIDAKLARIERRMAERAEHDRALIAGVPGLADMLRAFREAGHPVTRRRFYAEIGGERIGERWAWLDWPKVNAADLAPPWVIPGRVSKRPKLRREFAGGFET